MVQEALYSLLKKTWCRYYCCGGGSDLENAVDDEREPWKGFFFCCSCGFFFGCCPFDAADRYRYLQKTSAEGDGKGAGWCGQQTTPSLHWCFGVESNVDLGDDGKGNNGTMVAARWLARRGCRGLGRRRLSI